VTVKIRNTKASIALLSVGNKSPTRKLQDHEDNEPIAIAEERDCASKSSENISLEFDHYFVKLILT
jgi:hypothetical protein